MQWLRRTRIRRRKARGGRLRGEIFPYNAGVPPRTLTRDELVSRMLPSDWFVVAVHCGERASTIRMPLGQRLVHRRDAPGAS